MVKFSGVLFGHFSGLEGEIHEKTKFLKLHSSCVEKRACVVTILYIVLKCGEYDYEVYGAMSEVERKDRYYQIIIEQK